MAALDCKLANGFSATEKNTLISYCVKFHLYMKHIRHFCFLVPLFANCINYYHRAYEIDTSKKTRMTVAVMAGIRSLDTHTYIHTYTHTHDLSAFSKALEVSTFIAFALFLPSKFAKLSEIDGFLQSFATLISSRIIKPNNKSIFPYDFSKFIGFECHGVFTILIFM